MKDLYNQKKREFIPEIYLRKKIKAIEDFLQEENIDAVVLGISGGIDSAVTLGILTQIDKKYLKKIQPLMMPIFYSNGVSNQQAAVDYARQVLLKYQFPITTSLRDLSVAHHAYRSINAKTSNWAYGQLDSILRTPQLYFEAAMLQEQGYKSLVVGTTNRDEISYVGFYGKASDAMVDLQIISDLHKSEVYELAEILEVPKEIINRTPTGDTFDASSDEKTIGAPYWFVEFYTTYLKTLDPEKLNDLVLSYENSDMYFNWINNIELIHNKNKHKYKVGYPSRFIDVQDRLLNLEN